MFFDYFLSNNWNQFNDIELSDYLNDFYKILLESSNNFEKKVQIFILKLIEFNWLNMYKDLKIILNQMKYKTKFKSNLNLSIVNLKEDYSFYEKIFLH